MSGGYVYTLLSGLVAGALGTYVTFYLRGALARREQIAKSLADFYSSAAVAYYAASDLEKAKIAHKPEQDVLTFHKLFDAHYKEFLSASTVLASLVPPTLREDVLGIEDLWDEINRKNFSSTNENEWFDTLDDVRYKILDSISYSRFSDPFWKF